MFNNGNEKKSVKVNYLYNLSYQILIVFIPLVTTPYISRVLSVNGVGIYSYTYSIVSYFVILATLGTTTYAQREIASCQDDKKKLSTSFFEIIIFRGMTVFVSVILYLIVVMQLFKSNKIIFVIQGIYILNIFFDVTWFFQGMEEFKVVIVRNFIIKIMNLLYVFLCVKGRNALLLYTFGLVLFSFVGNISVWIYLKRYIYWVELTKLHPLRNIKEILELFIPTVAMQVYLVLDKSMIGWFSGESCENGYYEQAEKIVKLCLTIITSMGVVMIPRISFLYEKGNTKKIYETINKSYHFVWFLSIPICMGLFILSNDIVIWYLGKGYEKSGLLIKILCFLIPVIGLSNVTGLQYFVSVKKQRLLTRSVMLGAGINFVVNILLIPHFFSLGAAVATVIAETVVTVAQLFFAAKDNKSFPIKLIFKDIYIYVCSSIFMVVILKIIPNHFTVLFLYDLFLVIIGFLIYIVCMLLWKEKITTSIAKKIMEKIFSLYEK